MKNLITLFLITLSVFSYAQTNSKLGILIGPTDGKRSKASNKRLGMPRVKRPKCSIIRQKPPWSPIKS